MNGVHNVSLEIVAALTLYGLVADESEGKADQDRREDREPWPLCRVSDGRSHHSQKSLRRHPTNDRRTSTADRSSGGEGESPLESGHWSQRVFEDDENNAPHPDKNDQRSVQFSGGFNSDGYQY
jgi:hypothetical protein